MILQLIFCGTLLPFALTAQEPFFSDSANHKADSSGILFTKSIRDGSAHDLGAYALNYGGLFYQPRFSFSQWDLFGQYDSYLFDPSLSLPLTDSTFTNAFYSYGLDDSHQFRIDFSDKVGSTHLNLVFDRSSSLGIIPQSDTKIQNFAVQAKGESGRFNYGVGYSSGLLLLEENAGIADVVDFDTVSTISQFSTNGKLRSASSDLKRRSVTLKNELNLGKLQVDTLDSLRIKRNRHYLVTSAELSDEQAVFRMDASDIDSMVFPQALINNNETNDSIGLRSILLSGGYRFSGKDERTGITLLYHNQRNDFDPLNRSSLFAELKRKWWGMTIVQADYTLSGRWRNAISINGRHQKYFGGGDFFAAIKVDFERALPSYFYDHYQSNHYTWENNFVSATAVDLGASLYAKRLGLAIEINQKNRTGWVYFNEVLDLVQSINTLSVFSSKIKHQFHSKYLHIYTTLLYQDANNSDVIRLPAFSFRNMLSYNFKLFHLKWTLGYDLSYWTQYEGYAFNPALRTTYLQNGTKVGGMPLLDCLCAHW